MQDSGVGFMYIWRYDVNPGDAAKFEELYGPEGRWARFFARSSGYVGTDLLYDPEAESYVTVDRWRSEEAHAAFVAENKAEFDELDKAGERLSRDEKLIGKFDVVPVAGAGETTHDRSKGHGDHD